MRVVDGGLLSMMTIRDQRVVRAATHPEMKRRRAPGRRRRSQPNPTTGSTNSPNATTTISPVSTSVNPSQVMHQVHTAATAASVNWRTDRVQALYHTGDTAPSAPPDHHHHQPRDRHHPHDISLILIGEAQPPAPSSSPSSTQQRNSLPALDLPVVGLHHHQHQHHQRSHSETTAAVLKDRTLNDSVQSYASNTTTSSNSAGTGNTGGAGGTGSRTNVHHTTQQMSPLSSGTPPQHHNHHHHQQQQHVAMTSQQQQQHGDHVVVPPLQLTDDQQHHHLHQHYHHQQRKPSPQESHCSTPLDAVPGLCIATKTLHRRGLSRPDGGIDDLSVQPSSPEPHQYYERRSLLPQHSDAEPSYSVRYTSGESSPVTEASHSSHSYLSTSNNEWTTGNTTERSSIISLGLGEDEFDRKASRKVKKMFDDIDLMLYEQATSASHGQLNIAELKDWLSKFPHFRLLGTQIKTREVEQGYQYVAQSPRPNTANMLTDVTDQDISDVHAANELSVMGHHMDARKLNTNALLRTAEHAAEDAAFHEEILAEDGTVEDIIAVDYRTFEDDRSDHHTSTQPSGGGGSSSTPYSRGGTTRGAGGGGRRRWGGIVPVSPHSCVRENIIDLLHDYMWAEVVSWMRSVNQSYSIGLVGGSNNRSISVAPPDVLDLSHARGELHSREQSNLSYSTGRLEKVQHRMLSTHSTDISNTAVTSTQHLYGVLTISTKALQTREKSNLGDNPDSSVGGVMLGRPTSSVFHGRPFSVMVGEYSRHPSARKTNFRAKLPSLDHSKLTSNEGQKQMATQVVRGKRMFSPSPQGFQKNGVLPPLDATEHKASRASSAIHDKDHRLSYRENDRYHQIDIRPDTRPNTTLNHYPRTETPSARLRSTTPNPYSNKTSHFTSSAQSGTSHHTYGQLNITGSSIPPLAEGGSPEHDVNDPPLEDMHPNWNPSSLPASHLRKSKTAGVGVR